MFKSTPTDKAKKHLDQGDKYFGKGQYEKALKCYQKAKENLVTPEVLDRLLKTQEKIDKKWDEADFLENLNLVMQKQEIENPALKRVTARLDEEWRLVTAEIKKLLTVDTEGEEEIIQNILNFGERALYPLLDFVMSLKKTRTELASSLGPKNESHEE